MENGMIQPKQEERDHEEYCTCKECGEIIGHATFGREEEFEQLMLTGICIGCQNYKNELSNNGDE